MCPVLNWIYGSRAEPTGKSASSVNQLTLVLLAPVYFPKQFPQQRARETLPT